MAAYAAATGGAGWADQSFWDGDIGGIHCGAGAADGGTHTTLFDNACLLAWNSACKIVISCLMASMSVFIDCAFVLLAICIVPITLLMTSVMVFILLSSLSDNYCAFTHLLLFPRSIGFRMLRQSVVSCYPNHD